MQRLNLKVIVIVIVLTLLLTLIFCVYLTAMRDLNTVCVCVPLVQCQSLLYTFFSLCCSLCVIFFFIFLLIFLFLFSIQDQVLLGHFKTRHPLLFWYQSSEAEDMEEEEGLLPLLDFRGQQSAGVHLVALLGGIPPGDKGLKCISSCPHPSKPFKACTTGAQMN